MYAKALIDKARERCKSDAEVARLIGISPPVLNQIKHGSKKMSPESAAILAAAIGEDVVYAVQKVMMENARPELATRLQKAFKVAASVAGVVAGSLLAVAHSDTEAANREATHANAECTGYTLSRLARLLALMARMIFGSPRRPVPASVR